MGTQKPPVLPVKVEAIPADLRALPKWVMWRLVHRQRPDGTRVWAKLPMTIDGTPASSTDPATWTDFDSAVDTLIMGGYEGIGVVLGDEVQGIDLDDCRDPATGELAPLAQEVLERVAGYAEVSPSGTGLKIFSKTNLDASRTKKEIGVELYGGGRYFTVTGHAINGHSALPAEVQDLGWLVEKVWGEPLGERAVLEGDAAERALALYREPLEDWDLQRVVDEVLPHLDPDAGYDEWLRVGAALHHQGQGDPEWLQAWDDWSAASGKWVEGVCAQKWDSFSEQRVVGRGAVTLASLLKATAEARAQVSREARKSAVDLYLADIKACTDVRDLQDQIGAHIANNPALGEVDREILALAMRDRSGELGTKMPIATTRGWVKNRSTSVTATLAPDWIEGWVYITDGDKFFDTRSKAEVTPQGFRAMHNRLMPFDAQGNRERADQWAVEQWNVPVVAHKAYMPGAGAVFEMFGLQWVNLYRPESVPEMPDEYTPEDLEAIEAVEEHLRTYLASERERALLMSWIAWNVQHPGVKIRWAPYVHGVPGDGKSFFSELVAVAMGGQNVRSLNGSTLESNFTDWASGYALVAIEEMKQHGHNRYDIMNRLKPFITNSQIEIHPKGRASYTAPNVSNYIIFSNYLDGAPVDEGDRRYMFVSSQLTTRDAQRLTEAGYFKRLFDAIHHHPGAIRKWLLGFEPHPEFDANGRAPDTDVKRTVVELSKSDLELAAEDIIEEGTEGVCKEVISSAHLTRALEARGIEKPSTSKVTTLMTRLGYRMAFDRPKKWRGSPCRIWLLQGLQWKEREVISCLNQTSAVDDFLR